MERLRVVSDYINQCLPTFQDVWWFSLLGSSFPWPKSHGIISEEHQCPNQVSCQITALEGIDACCVNYPSGHFLLTQFWDTSPPIGANTSWTIHGLWPDYCKGGFDSFCDDKRSHSPSQITRILEDAKTGDNKAYADLSDFMSNFWLSWDGHNSNLWAHEWNKHGTCVSTLEPQCYDSDAKNSDANNDILDYFTHTIKLYSTLDTFGTLKENGIEPSDDKSYSLSDLEMALKKSDHGVPVTFKCHNHNELSEAWYHFKVRGSLRNALDAWSDDSEPKFIPTTPDGQISNCPRTGIRYLPKSSHVDNFAPTTVSNQADEPTQPSSTSSASSSPQPFSGRGHLKIRILKQESQAALLDHAVANQSPERVKTENSDSDNEYNGCLIRNGAWYAATSDSSCAIFSARDDVNHLEPEDAFETLNQNLLSNQDTEQQHYHLFTLSSSRAPCSFVSSSSPAMNQPGQDGRLSCERELSYQSIFNAHIAGTGDDKGRSKVLAWSNQHQTTFYAEKQPSGHKQEQLWNTEHDDEGKKRGVQIQIHWEAYR